MDKSTERVSLNAVYGMFDVSVTDSEEPDFICNAPHGFNFGVEVTDFYRTESDARLKRIRGYFQELLEGRGFRHKDDPKEIKVEEVTLVQPTGESKKLKAIIKEVSPHSETIALLMELIRAKNLKCSRYQKQIQPVDLVIHDVGSTLFFWFFTEFRGLNSVAV